MGHFNRYAHFCAVVALGLAGAAALPPTASAKTSKGPAQPADPAAQKAQAADAARASYNTGVKAFQAGKYDPAIQSLGAAISGGITGPEMARALYYRGASYKKQNKIGLAISDLTSAIWLKNGLSDDERQKATLERADAYRVAGLNDSGVPARSDGTAAVAAPASPPIQTATSSPAVAPSQVSAPAQPVARTTYDPDAGPSSAALARRAAVAPVPEQGISTGSFYDAEPARPAAVAPIEFPQPQPQLQPPPSQAQTTLPPLQAPSPIAGNLSGPSNRASQPVFSAAPVEGNGGSAAPLQTASNSTLYGFFSNMFSNSGTSGPPAASAGTGSAVVTSSTERPVSVAAPAASVSSWSEPASVPAAEPGQQRGQARPQKKPAQSASAKALQVASLGSTPAAAPPSATKPGKYKAHIAAFRSRAEAEALAQRLAQQGNVLQNRSPAVDEAVIGSMGTFYRVRIGSFATADEPGGLCKKLRSSGFDCLVVTN